MIHHVDQIEDTSALNLQTNDYVVHSDSEFKTAMYRFRDGALERVPKYKRQVKGANSEHHAFIDAFGDPSVRIINIFGNAGSGKCLGKGTKIIMYDGSIKAVEDVVPGDLLMGPDSTPREVLTTCRGYDDLYLVKQNKGIDYVVNKDHILALKEDARKSTKVVNKKRITTSLMSKRHVEIPIHQYLEQTPCWKRKHKGYKVPIDFSPPTEECRIDPYVLGVWLGDGCATIPVFTTLDKEIVEALKEFCRNNNLRLREYPDGKSFAVRKPVRNSGYIPNPFTQALRSYDLIGNKHIPDRFRLGTREERLSLLAGLIDTDGHTDNRKGGNMEFFTTSLSMAEDVAFVGRSLGFYCRVSPKRQTCRCVCPGGKGEYLYENHESFRVNICGDTSIIPVKIQRKIPVQRLINKDPLITGITVEAIGEGDYYGFTIDGDGLFLLEDFTVTHNTFVPLGCALEDVLAGKYRKVIVIRELVPATKWGMGFLPGTKDEKINPMFGAIFDTLSALACTKIVGQDPEKAYDDLVYNNAIEFTTLQGFRGRSLANSVVFCDDAQNLDKDNIRLIVTRISQGSKLILGGDITQIDDPEIGVVGMRYLDDVMRGSTRYASMAFTHSSLRDPLVAEFLEREKELQSRKRP